MSDHAAATDATWPAARLHVAGGWLVREGLGGGKRVSSATPLSGEAAATIALAEAQHAALGQPALFCLRSADTDLDGALAARGYRIDDPVVVLEGDIGRIGSIAPDHLSSFPVWPPLAIMVDLWREGGIGPARFAVMERVTGPKAAILGRAGDRAAGVAFVACQGDVAMVHALHVADSQRRQGLGRNLMRAAARWADGAGARTLAVAVRAENHAARALYAGLGMTQVSAYHYRAR